MATIIPNIITHSLAKVGLCVLGLGVLIDVWGLSVDDCWVWLVIWYLFIVFFGVYCVCCASIASDDTTIDDTTIEYKINAPESPEIPLQDTALASVVD